MLTPGASGTGPAASLAAATFILSYVGQRLWALSDGNPADVIAEAHIPLYWRAALASVHAAVVFVATRRLDLEPGGSGSWWLAAAGATAMVIAP